MRHSLSTPDKLAQAVQATPVRPLSPSETVPDETLRDFARLDTGKQQFTLSAEDQALLAMILPDICGELLAYRRAAQVSPRGTPRNHDDEIANLRFLEGDFTPPSEPVGNGKGQNHVCLCADELEQIKGLIEYLCDEAATSAVVLSQIAQQTAPAFALDPESGQ